MFVKTLFTAPGKDTKLESGVCERLPEYLFGANAHCGFDLRGNEGGAGAERSRRVEKGRPLPRDADVESTLFISRMKTKKNIMKTRKKGMQWASEKVAMSYQLWLQPESYLSFNDGR